jgi:hypothetical protein
MSDYEIATLKGLLKAAPTSVEVVFSIIRSRTYSQPFQGWDPVLF